MPESAHLAGPAVAFVTIAVLTVVLCRSLLRDSTTSARVTAQTPDEDEHDYGLLATATVVSTLAEADVVREHLSVAGIRATLATAQDGQIRVLVFANELMRARRVVG